MMLKLLKVLAASVAMMFAGFVVLGLLGAWDAPASSSPKAARQEACSRAWNDAAPGQEKRTARAMCDALGVTP